VEEFLHGASAFFGQPEVVVGWAEVVGVALDPDDPHPRLLHVPLGDATQETAVHDR